MSETHCGSMRYHGPHDDCPGTSLSAAWEAKDRSAANTVQAALNRVGRKLTVRDVKALEELDAAFRQWADGKAGSIWWETETRLAQAIADVIHVELVEADPDE